MAAPTSRSLRLETRLLRAAESRASLLGVRVGVRIRVRASLLGVRVGVGLSLGVGLGGHLVPRSCARSEVELSPSAMVKGMPVPVGEAWPVSASHRICVKSTEG